MATKQLMWCKPAFGNWEKCKSTRGSMILQGWRSRISQILLHIYWLKMVFLTLRPYMIVFLLQKLICHEGSHMWKKHIYLKRVVFLLKKGFYIHNLAQIWSSKVLTLKYSNIYFPVWFPSLWAQCEHSSEVIKFTLCIHFMKIFWITNMLDVIKNQSLSRSLCREFQWCDDNFVYVMQPGICIILTYYKEISANKNSHVFMLNYFKITEFLKILETHFVHEFNI